MSVIKKTESGGFTAQLSIGSGKGRIRQNKTFTTKREALEWLAQQQAVLSGPKALMYQRKMTVLGFYDLWIDTKKINLSKNTLNSYFATKKRLSPYFKTVKITKISHQQLQNVFTVMSKKYSHETLRKDLGHLRSMIRYAMHISVLTTKIDPTEGIVIGGTDLKCPKTADDKVIPLAEFKNIRDHLKKHEISKDDNHERNLLGISIAVATGLRGGEVLALRFKDIDFDEYFLTVNHSWADELVQPKTRYSYRKVPIPKWLVHKIKKWAALRHTPLNSDKQVMLRSDGTIGRVTSLTASFKNLQKKLGFLGSHSLHHIRHTIASHLLDKGVNIVTVSRLLGHSSIRITEIYYLGLVNKDQVDERRKVLGLL